MSGVLVVTGLTGKKSGGAFARRMAESRNALEALFPQGIRAMVRPSSDTEALEALLPQAELRRGSFDDPAFLDDALRGADTLLHIAGIHLSLPLVQAAARQRVRRLILVHTTGIYSKYKAAGEEYRQIDRQIKEICRSSGMILSILRPTMIYGDLTDHNLSVFIRMVDRFAVMPVVRGARYRLQPVYYQDLAEAYLRVLFREAATAGKDYDLSGGAPILLRDMLTEIGAQLGKKRVRFLSCPFWLAYGGALGLWGLSLGRVDYREKVQRLCEDRAYPHEAAARDFGYAPLEFAEGIRGEIRDYLDQRRTGAI